MNSILESGNLIRRIKDGENLSEIAHYALECLYRDGPIDTVVLEIISYLKIFQPDFFATVENDVIEIMGLFFKSPTPETLQGVVFDIYSQLIRENWGDNYTPMQADILKQINSKQCFSFSAPTSTGKSFVFRNVIMKSQKDIVVVVPSRALIRYGFNFEDIDWLKPHVKSIDEEEICFYGTVSELDSEKSAIIEKFLY